MAIAAGDEDPVLAAGRLLAAAGASRERLERAHLILIERLRSHSNDFEATFALRIVERALDEAPYPDGPWRWQHELSPRRMRATRRRRARAIRRGRGGPHLQRRASWRART
ncbi:MAG TPA: hypothetical protein VJS45_03675 [Acidimicrobiia bacterium]|nr:hypothetical protein [Acidimicrobiia bacterium]